MLNKLVGLEVSVKPLIKSSSASYFSLFTADGNKLIRPYGYYKGEQFSKYDIKQAVKGFKISKDKFVFFKNAELETLNENVSKEIEILGKAYKNELPEYMRGTSKYSLTGIGKNERDVALLMKSLEADNSIFVVRFCIRSRAKYGTLYSYKNLLVMEELNTQAYPIDSNTAGYGITESEVEQMTKLTDEMHRNKFINFELKDKYSEALEEAVAKKLENPNYTIAVIESKEEKQESKGVLEMLQMCAGEKK